MIVSGVRTAIGTFNGSLKHTHQHDLGAAVIREAIARAGIAPQDIDETIVGNVGQIAESGFIARICQLRAGIPQESTAYSVNRQCGSGLQATADGMMQLQSGRAEVVVACGTENMTQLPYYLRKARDGYRMGHGELEDGLISILTAGRPLSQRHHRGKRRATLRYYPRSDGRFRPVEPAEGAEGDRGRSLSRADPPLRCRTAKSDPPVCDR